MMPNMTINNTAISTADDLIPLITEHGIVMQPGAEHLFPAVIKLDSYNGDYEHRPCATIAFTFFLRNSSATFSQDSRIQIQVVTPSGNVIKDSHDVYFYHRHNWRGFRSSVNWKDDVKVIESNSNILTRDEFRYSITFCRMRSNIFSRHKLYYTDSSSTVEHRYSDGRKDYKVDFDKTLSIKIIASNTDMSDDGHRIVLRSWEVVEGGMDLLKLKDMPTMGCLLESAIRKSTTMERRCILCNKGYVLKNSKTCVPNKANTPDIPSDTSKITSITESQCIYLRDDSSCYQFDPSSYYYDRVSNTLASSLLDSSGGSIACGYSIILPATDGVTRTKYCESSPVSEPCGQYAKYDATPTATLTCRCTVTGCTTCATERCSACSASKLLIIYSEDDYKCESTVPAQYGKDKTRLPTDVYRSCQIVGCSNCTDDYLRCATCDPLKWQCFNMCYYTCDTCTTTMFDTQQCGKCLPGLTKILSNSTCMNCSIDGLSAVSLDGTADNKICVQCGVNCKSCNNLKGDNCTSCITGSALDMTAYTCGPCPVGKFGVTDTSGELTCYDCLPGCLNCTNNVACSSCLPGMFMYQDATCKACSEQGRIGIGKYCEVCDKSCKTCSDILPTNCTSCEQWYWLTKENKCLAQKFVKIEEVRFIADLKEIIIKFDTLVKPIISSITDISEMIIYKNPKSQIIIQVTGSSQPLPSISSLSPVQGYTFESILIKEDSLRVKISVTETISNATFAIRFKQLPAIISQSDVNTVFKDQVIVVEDINLIYTALDKAMAQSAASVGAAVTSISTLILLLSIPQAFILMKLFQMIDFYIYIDCDFPTNFSAFLAIMSQGIMDMMPNFFEKLADDKGIPVYPRFEQFGLNIHVFLNLGRHLSVTLMIGGIKLVLWLLKIAFKKTKFKRIFAKANKSIGIEIFYGIVEAFHLDIVLAIIIHIVLRDKVGHGKIGINYLSIVLLCFLTLGLFGLYIFMAYKVRGLSLSYKKFVVLDIAHMKGEAWRFLLENKKPYGNIFQRHYNLICMLRDLLFCLFLFFSYNKPLLTIIVILIVHLALAVMTFLWPPFILPWHNTICKINAVVYTLLDIMILIAIAANDMSASTRYNYLGYPLIATVVVIIVSNIGFSMYYGARGAWAKFKKWKARKNKSKVAPNPVDADQSAVELKSQVQSLDSSIAKQPEVGSKPDTQPNKKDRQQDPKKESELEPKPDIELRIAPPVAPIRKAVGSRKHPLRRRPLKR